MPTGQIVILNGEPRAGKSSIAAALQDGSEAAWINLGVDAAMAMTPRRFLPGIGLRPGGERPDLEPFVVRHFAAVYAAIAAHALAGLNVVADFGHHDDYSVPLHILEDAAKRLEGLPVLFVGIRCSLTAIMARRNADPSGRYLGGDSVPDPVRRWHEAVHAHVIYDLELDTSVLVPGACAAEILRVLAAPPSPSAFERLRASPTAVQRNFP